MSVVAMFAALAALWTAPAHAYVEAPYTLGRLIAESTNIMTVRVEKVEKERNLIIFSKIADLKGKHPTDVIKHNIGRGGFHPREWQAIMAWAEPGKVAVFFHNGGASETCIDGYWYQAYAGGEWWNMSHGEPYLLRSYFGRPQKLATAVTALLAGQEVIVPCMVDGDKNSLALRTARVQRLRASMKLQDYNPKRDFVGWGGNDDYRRIAGMPGFSHVLALGRVDPGAGGVAPADFDGDGQVDLCVWGAGRVMIMQNSGNSLNEASLPLTGGARSADWADYDGDGKPDLLLATPTGPRLFTNQGGTFRDDTAGLPAEPYYNATAAAWIDYNHDGRPDILLANGFRGLRLYRNIDPAEPAKPAAQGVGPWHYIGPFDNPGGTQGFDKVYAPEQKIDLAAKYPGKGGEQAVWREGKFTDGQVNSLSLFPGDNNQNVVVYIHRQITVGAAMDLPISLGSDDGLAVWLNGQKLVSENVSRGAAPDQNMATLKLKPGRNDLLLKICQGAGDFAFYYAAKAALPAAPAKMLFEDVTEQAGLGPDGVGGKVKGDRLAVADVNGDGKPDFLYSAGSGVLAINTGGRFVESADSGIHFDAGRVTPVFGDFDGDKKPDLFVPQSGQCRLFHNDGGGRFTDVTGSSDDLAQPMGAATSAVWVDLSGKGRPDLLIGCLFGPNRFLRNAGGGRFIDAGAQIGLYNQVFNTRGLCAVDLNKDGSPDIVFNNEGQDSTVLLADPARVARKE